MAIDRNGNITLNRASDLFIPLARKSSEGDPIDLSSAILKFVAQGCFSIIPEPDPADPMQVRLHFTTTHAASLTKPASFILQFTRSDGSREVIWQGTISATGFATSVSAPTPPPVTSGVYTIQNTLGTSTIPANQIDGAVAALTALFAKNAQTAAILASRGF